MLEIDLVNAFNAASRRYLVWHGNPQAMPKFALCLGPLHLFGYWP